LGYAVGRPFGGVFPDLLLNLGSKNIAVAMDLVNHKYGINWQKYEQQ